MVLIQNIATPSWQYSSIRDAYINSMLQQQSESGANLRILFNIMNTSLLKYSRSNNHLKAGDIVGSPPLLRFGVTLTQVSLDTY